MKPRIVLADDHTLFRKGLYSLIGEHEEFNIVGEATNGQEALDICRELKPDILLLDVAMPGLNGIEAARILSQENREIKILALSMHADKNYVYEMLTAGAVGYLLKDSALEDLTAALKAVMKGGYFLSPQITKILVKRLQTGEPLHNAEVDPSLTERELEVLKLVADGLNSREIAANLNISTRTVEAHRRQIMSKLSLRSVAELTKYSIKHGISSLD